MRRLIVALFTFFPMLDAVAQLPLGTTTEGALDPKVASLQLFAGEEQLSYPVLPLGGGGSLTLAFDMLGSQVENLNLRIVRCEAGWTLSPLRDVEYLKGYASTPINTFQASQQTRVRYIHYTQQVPWQGLEITKSGNYLLVATRYSAPNTPLFIMRFLVMEQLLSPAPQLITSAQAGNQRTHQRLQFALPVDRTIVRDATRELSVTLLQNFRWDIAHTNVRPVYVYPDRLEYDLTPEVEFPGLNEFRQFDLRALRTKGMNVATIQPTDSGALVQLMPEGPRHAQRYLAQNDQDGLVYYGLGPADLRLGAIEADYAWVQFRLQAPGVFAAEDVVLLGSFNHYNPRPGDVLAYNPATKTYETRLLLKQGVYNYLYALQNRQKPGLPDSQRLEGSYQETRNTYTVLVYYRPLGERYDRLMGVGWWRAAD